MPILSFDEYVDYLDGTLTDEELAILDSIYEKVDQYLRQHFDGVEANFTIQLESATYYNLSERMINKLVENYSLSGWEAHVEAWTSSDPVAASGIYVYLIAD